MLRPNEQVFEAMIKGWRGQQLARNPSLGYVDDQERTVRAFTRHADAMPWQWTPQHVDEWSADLRAVHGCVRSTLRNYQGSVRQFCPIRKGQEGLTAQTLMPVALCFRRAAGLR
ncbi:hypothetical protein OH805_16175 [Streptomyces sp. NBC_00879]|uniref:hypothetical protein n=1 Tax=Streptomyces sp. NBC_00879 TaxID=2975855 RepID=UPI0038647EAF|nr:hypothetical protein OH805_16175 [Streptomyces sp. NBC_00879]